MMDQSFHTSMKRFAGWQRDFIIRILVRAAWKICQNLLNDRAALSHFFNPYTVTIKNVTVILNGDLKIIIFIAAVRLRFTNIPIHPRSSQCRAAQTPIDRFFPSKSTNTFCTVQPYRIVGEQSFVFIYFCGKILYKIKNAIQP